MQSEATQPVTVRIHTSAGAFPAGVRTLVGATQIFNVPDQNLSLFTATFTTASDCTCQCYPGGRNIYTSRAARAILSLSEVMQRQKQRQVIYQQQPAVFLTLSLLASLGFPNMHTIINATGTVSPSQFNNTDCWYYQAVVYSLLVLQPIHSV